MTLENLKDNHIPHKVIITQFFLHGEERQVY